MADWLTIDWASEVSFKNFFAEMNWSSQFLEADNDSALAFSSQHAIVLFQLIFGVRILGAELMRTVGILTWRGGQP